jgi:hypothetical protein
MQTLGEFEVRRAFARRRMFPVLELMALREVLDVNDACRLTDH